MRDIEIAADAICLGVFPGFFHAANAKKRTDSKRINRKTISRKQSIAKQSVENNQ